MSGGGQDNPKPEPPRTDGYRGAAEMSGRERLLVAAGLELLLRTVDVEFHASLAMEMRMLHARSYSLAEMIAARAVPDIATLVGRVTRNVNPRLPTVRSGRVRHR